MEKAKNIFLWIDKRFNWLAGGNIENTISGRLGYYANNSNTSVRWYWWIMQFIVDLTFYPLDGHHHCLDSWIRDETKGDYKPTKYAVFFFILSILTVSSCLILILPFYLLLILGVFNRKNL